MRKIVRQQRAHAITFDPQIGPGTLKRARKQQMRVGDDDLAIATCCERVINRHCAGRINNPEPRHARLPSATKLTPSI